MTKLKLTLLATPATLFSTTVFAWHGPDLDLAQCTFRDYVAYLCGKKNVMKLCMTAFLAIAAFAVAPGDLRAANLTTLYSFCSLPGCADGNQPMAGLIADANGNLFGTTGGTVFEVAKTANGYANTLNTLVSFNGAHSQAGLIADASGNLYGTTGDGGAYGLGTVFEVVKTAAGYASTPVTLVSFNGTNGAQPFAGLVADVDGNLLGTTAAGGVNDLGTVFEIAKTAGGYASTPNTLVTFNGPNGASPGAALIIDANGNLFGTTYTGGAGTQGTVFEITKTANGYASTPITLVAFNGTNGGHPSGSLVADTNGNLFSTTGGLAVANGRGTVFEVAKIAGGYDSTPITLVAFDGNNGASPAAGLIIDANGNLFGTVFSGGLYDLGTVFEVAKNAGTYGSTPITLVDFSGANGAHPLAGLLADANGNLLGTTGSGGAKNSGTVFEITGSGFVPVTFAGTPGNSNCYGKSISALAQQYGGLNAAAAALGYPSVQALQQAITAFCEG